MLSPSVTQGILMEILAQELAGGRIYHLLVQVRYANRARIRGADDLSMLSYRAGVAQLGG